MWTYCGKSADAQRVCWPGYSPCHILDTRKAGLQCEFEHDASIQWTVRKWPYSTDTRTSSLNTGTKWSNAQYPCLHWLRRGELCLNYRWQIVIYQRAKTLLSNLKYQGANKDSMLLLLFKVYLRWLNIHAKSRLHLTEVQEKTSSMKTQHGSKHQGTAAGNFNESAHYTADMAGDLWPYSIHSLTICITIVICVFFITY